MICNIYAHRFVNPLSAAVVAVKATSAQNTTGQVPNVQGGGNSDSTMFPGITGHGLAGTASVNDRQAAYIAQQGVAGQQWETGGGTGSVNGLGGIATMGTGFVGANVRHIGAGGNVPHTQAVGLGGRAHMWRGAVNLVADGLGRYANCFGGGLKGGGYLWSCVSQLAECIWSQIRLSAYGMHIRWCGAGAWGSSLRVSFPQGPRCYQV